MSLVLHVVLLTTIGWLWSPIRQGTGETEDRPIGVAMVHRMPDRDRYVDVSEQTQQLEEATDATATAASSSAAPPADVAPTT